MEMPIVVLKSGLRVANFSSPHEFRFDTGEVLPACSPERAKSLMLDNKETVSDNPFGWSDVKLEFLMSEEVERELIRICEEELGTFNVLLVPLPVREAIKNLPAQARAEPVGGMHQLLNRDSAYRWILDVARVCRTADRVTKTIYGDRFCL